MANPVRNRWAFLVGINEYKYRGFGTLQYCVNDVEALDGVLTAADYAIVRLDDTLPPSDYRFPTRQNIKHELEQLCEKVGPDDLLLVYFAGHGTRAGDGKPRLVAQDTPVEYIDTEAISISELERWMRASDAERLIVMLDACHIGSGTDQRGAIDPEFVRNVHGLATGFALIAASTYQQSAREVSGIKRGLFSHYLCQGLAGKVKSLDPNVVTVQALYSYVLNELTRRGVIDGVQQQPMGRFDGMGDMILADWRLHEPPDLEQLSWQAAGEAGSQLRSARALLAPYLNWLVHIHGQLELRGIQVAQGYPVIPLEKIYVALKGDRTSAYERLQSREMLDMEAIRHLMANLEETLPPEEYEERLEYYRRQILVEHPHMLSLVERDRAEKPPLALTTDVVTLGKAFCQHRWLVILGDPGSGKTTLAKWLTLKLAKALLTGVSRLEVLNHQVDPEAITGGAKLDLGIPRLPVMVRVSDYAKAYSQSQLMLIDYLGHHPWLGQYPANAEGRLSPEGLNLLIREYLRRGQAVIILDGMDEITTSTRRDDIVLAIETFIQHWINTPGEPQTVNLDDSFSRYISEGSPLEVGGNQIIITSRIAGYHASPVRGAVTHFTIEPMERTAVEHFCDTWTQAIYQYGRYGSGQSPELARQQAEKEARNLKQAIYSPQQRQIQALASNPLLVTALAIVFHRRGRLPEQRASLYRQTLKILIDDWQRDRQERDRQDRQVQQIQERTGFSTDELIYVLSPLAAHIHAHYATGLIQEPELREVLSENLAQLSQYQGQAEQPGFKHKIEQFLRVLREDVGLLAARGEYLYGFLHLTFQEYLAALFLVRDKSTAAEEIIQRMDDPRWREPILLAFGHVGTTWSVQSRDQLIRAILNADDPLSDLLPRAPLLIAGAISEMPDVSRGILIEIIERLIFAYADRQGIYQIEPLRHRIEKALSALRTEKNKAIVDQVFCKLLKAPPQSLPQAAAAVASLVHIQYWFTAEIVEALFVARVSDREDWDWPVHAAIRALIAFDSSQQAPEAPKPPDDESLKGLRETDFFKYQEQVVRYALAEEAYKEKLAKYESTRQIENIGLPSNSLPFQQALLQSERLTEIVISNPDWLRLVTVLYGGYFDYQAHETFKDYSDTARWLQMPDDIREDQIRRERESYVKRFGYDDLVYSAAVYLDTGMEGKQARARTCPAFSPQAIYKESTLTRHLLPALSANLSPTELVPGLWKLWQDSSSAPMLQVEAMLALIALGEEVTKALEEAFKTDSRKALAVQVLTRLSQLHHGLRDTVTRSLNANVLVGVVTDDKGKEKKQYEELLHRILNGFDTLNADQWCVLIDCLSELTISYSHQASDLPKPPQHIPVEAQSRFLAERWSYRFLGGVSDDLVYNCAIALDEMTATDPFLLIEVFSTFSKSKNLRWDGASFAWEIEQLTPPSNNQKDIPLEIIDIIENSYLDTLLPGFSTALLSTFLNAAVPLVRQNPQLIYEALISNLSNRENPEVILQQLAPEVALDDALPQRLLDGLSGMADPYYRTRALIRFARYSSGHRDHCIQEALTSARQVTDAHERCRLLEYLLLSVDDVRRSPLLQEIESTANQIRNPNLRSRTIGRLSRYFSGAKQEYLVREAMLAAATIKDKSQQAELFNLLTPLAKANPDLLSDLRKIARAMLSDNWGRAKALGLKGQQMAAIPRSSQNTFQNNPAQAELWTILTLGATVDSLLNYFQKDIDNLEGLWLQLAATADAEIAHRLQEIGIEQGLTLTRSAANAITTLAGQPDSSPLHRLLPLLQNSTVEAIPMIESWLSYPDQTLANHAALYLAEPNRQLTIQTIDGLLALTTSKQDRSRARACLVIEGVNGTAFERESRTFKASEMDKRVLFKVAEALVREQSKSSVMGLFMDILHDDPEWLDELANIVEQGGIDALAAEEMLQWLFALTSESWRVVEKLIQSQSARVIKPLLLSVCYMFVSSNKLAYYEDPTSFLLGRDSQALSQIRVLPTHIDPVIRSALAVLKQNRSIEESIPLADLALATYAITIEDIVRDKGDIVRQLKLLPRDSKETDSISQESVMALLGQMGNTLSRETSTGNLFRKISVSEILVLDDARMFPFLVAWLQQALQDSIQNHGKYWKQTLLLSDVAIYARQSPSTFINLAKAQELEPILAQVIVEHNNAVGRKAACELVSHFSSIRTSTLNALLQALLDDRSVREAAMDAIRKLRRIDGNIIAGLIKELENPSATVASAAAQVLATLGQGERTPLAERRQITVALAEAVRSPHSKRGIYAIGGTGSQNSPKQLIYQGRLDQVLLKSLLEVTGNF